MKTGNFIFILAGLYGIAYITDKLLFADKVRFEIADISLDFDKIVPNFILTIKAINPTKTEVSIENLEATVFINDFVKIADIRLFSNATIMPTAETRLTFTILPDYKNVFNYIKNLIQNKKGYLTVKGSAVVDGLTIPLYLKYNIA